MAEQSIASVTVQLAANASRLNSGLASGRKSLSMFQKQVNALRGTMMTMFGATAAIGVFSNSVKIIADFEQGMADVKSILRPTAQDFEKLKAAAKELGQTTKFTNAEVAALQKELGKLGFTTKEILDSQAAVLQLAAATGEDLAQSATVAGITLRQFSLDASQMQRVVDVMARSFTASALDMTKFTESMKYVGPIANAAGISLEMATAMLAKLADAGIDGSMAGTSLREIINRLAKDGRPLKERLDELSKSGMTFSDAQDEVGKRAQTALIVLAKMSGELGGLETTFKNAGGAAKEMADVQIDTLIGKLTILKSAWQGLITEMGSTEGIEGSKSALEKLANVLNWVTKNIEHNRKVQGKQLKELNQFLKENKEWESSSGSLVKYENLGYFEKFASILKTTNDQISELVKNNQEYIKTDSEVDNKKIESISTLQFEVKRLKDLRDVSSISEVAALNKEIELIENKISYYQSLGKAINFKTSFMVDMPDAQKMGQMNPFAIDMELPEETFNDMKDVMKWYNEQLDTADIKTNLLTSSITAFGDAIMAVTSGSEDAFKSMVTAILSSIRDIISALLAKAIAGVIAGDAVKGGTIGLLAAGAIGIPMLMGLWSQVPSFAEGGLVYGETMARVGEYSGASSNPEVIAPLSKLESMLGGGSGQWETANVKIGFDQLEIALEKINHRRTSVYGLRG